MTTSSQASEPDRPARPDARARSTLRVCCTLHALHDGLVDMLYALLPVLAEFFGLNYAQVGMIRAANKAATASLQIPAGLLSERIGERVLLIGGTALAGLAFLALGQVSGFPMVLAMFFLAGAGAAVQHPLSSAMITAAWSGPGRRAALGTYNTFGDIGKFAFMGLAVLLLGGGLSWTVPVTLFGVAALACAALAAWLLRDVSGPSHHGPAATASGPQLKTSGWGLKNPRAFAALGAVATLDSATRSGFLTFAAFLMIEKGLDVAWAGSAVLLALLGGMCGKFACGLIAERIGVARAIIVTELLTGIGIALVVMLPAIWGFALLPLLGVVLNGTSSVIYGSVGDLIEEGRHARAFGFVYTLGSVCGIVAPLAYGALADAIGVQQSMLIAALTILLTLPLCIPLSTARAFPALRRPT
ncbi:MAG: MFS transporter [Gammaproteobacteria bacterium]|nr:MFS transporter [Gammaproteobacteria bacterium]